MRRFKPVKEELLQNRYEGEENLQDQVILPIRGTKTSAGYDFIAPFDLVIRPQEKVFFWSDVCAEMKDDEVLLLDMRSSLGVKKDLMLANTVAVIDSDYINAENGGNIGIMIRNLKPQVKYEIKENGELDVIPQIQENTIVIKKGEAVCQGIFVKFLESDNCNTEVERTGGFGSTNK